MSDYSATRKEIRQFIWSKNFHVSSSKDKALVYVGSASNQYRIRDVDVQNVRTSPGAVALDNTPGGVALNRILASSSIPNPEKVGLYEEANGKFISRAEGNLNVIFAKNSNLDTFKNWYLPQILDNSQITTVNHIEKKIIKHEFEKDQSISKHESKERIALVLQGKEDIAYLLGNKKVQDPEIEKKIAIEMAIAKIGGVELRDALNVNAGNLNKVSRELFKEHAFTKNHEVMGWRAKVFDKKFSYFFERQKIQKDLEAARRSVTASEKVVNNQKAKLLTKEGLSAIYEETNKILERKRNNTTLERDGYSQKLHREVEKYIEQRKPAPVEPRKFVFGEKEWKGPSPDNLYKKGRKL